MGEGGSPSSSVATNPVPRAKRRDGITRVCVSVPGDGTGVSTDAELPTCGGLLSQDKRAHILKAKSVRQVKTHWFIDTKRSVKSIWICCNAFLVTETSQSIVQVASATLSSSQRSRP